MQTSHLIGGFGVRHVKFKVYILVVAIVSIKDGVGMFVYMHWTLWPVGQLNASIMDCIGVQPGEDLHCCITKQWR